MDNEIAVKILIENELYQYVKLIKENYKGEKAKEAIDDFTEEFKKTVLKKYPVEDIDGLIKSTLEKMENNKERNSD